jgi:hypothetical protein
MTDKVTEIPMVERDSLVASLEAYKRNLAIIAGYGKDIAAFRRQLYLAHVEAGFTDAQALELCKSIAS